MATRIPSQAEMANWLPLMDALRTFLIAPNSGEAIDDLRLAGISAFQARPKPMAVPWT